MIQKITTSWLGNMQFDAVLGGHHLVMDAMPENGGNDAGPRPKELMIASLAGCTGMDVVSILNKMKIFPEKFDIEIEAELTEEHPKHYIRIHLIYLFKGKGMDEEKIKKAVLLSQDKYCGVSAVYRKTMHISHEIKILE